jgi:hypothetical protein
MDPGSIDCPGFVFEARASHSTSSRAWPRQHPPQPNRPGGANRRGFVLPIRDLREPGRKSTIRAENLSGQPIAFLNFLLSWVSHGRQIESEKAWFWSSVWAARLGARGGGSEQAAQRRFVIRRCWSIFHWFRTDHDVGLRRGRRPHPR